VVALLDGLEDQNDDKNVTNGDVKFGDDRRGRPLIFTDFFAPH
jgi:hypothetical protein